VHEIGETLGVDAILLGSLRQEKSQAHVTVQLIKVADGSQIWADSFDRELAHVFAIQSDLSLQIASALKATVLPMEANGIRRRPTNNPQAYLLYVQANDLFADVEKPRSKMEKAEQLLEDVIKMDPNFALAFALLSQIETVFLDYDPVPTRLEKARQRAEQALRLQPDLPEAHIAMGRHLWEGRENLGGRDLAAALGEFKIAQQSLPGDADLYTQIGRVQRQQGKWLEALGNLEKAAVLDPNTARGWDRLIGTNIWLRRYPAALQAIEREITVAPNSWRLEWLRAWVPMQWKGDLTALEHLRRPPETEYERSAKLWYSTSMILRRYDEAEALVRDYPRDTIPGFGLAAPKSLFLGDIYRYRKDEAKAREYFEAARPIVESIVSQSPLQPGAHGALSIVYSGLHRKEDAIREGKRACELLPESKDAIDGVDFATGLAVIYMAVDEPEQALTVLEHSLSVPAGAHVGQLRVSPTWDPLRNNPRFQQLLEKYKVGD
jgi:serine/threonine-protein kinase